VRLMRRKARPQAPPPEPAVRRESEAELAPDGLPHEAPAVMAVEPSGRRADDWEFPDPDEPAPTGLLPSTASARRAARLHQPVE
jgi:hypothetical protein